jgi:hypothetical protein
VTRRLREGLAKDKSCTVEDGVGEMEDRYNNIYPVGITCMPEEAWDGNGEMVSEENGPEGSYKNRFKGGVQREVLGRTIWVRKRKSVMGGLWREV